MDSLRDIDLMHGMARLEADGRVSLRFGDDVVYLEKQPTREEAKAQLADVSWIIAKAINEILGLR